LKLAGYQILVADPDQEAISIFDVDVSLAPTALLFGNELRGVSKEALEHCDQKVTIPMSGFTESLNISVSVAICLSTLVSRLNNSTVNKGLLQDEKDAIRLDWYRKIVRKSTLIEREFVRTIE
jgi:tRNA (guanosine-2'-O-)-methyltransferase